MPIGYLFLSEPPQEPLPIADFRTRTGLAIRRPSPNLLDTIYLSQQRQDWYREYARIHRLAPQDFVGSVTEAYDPVAVAADMRAVLEISVEDRQQIPTWTEALRRFIAKVDEAGVLVMASSIVGGNTHRKLHVEEFGGFALADDLAPLVFINTADSKAAQMFTLAHELAHLWLGKSGISNPETGKVPGHETERWCDSVAAELLMPMAETRQAYQPDLPVAEEIQRLARTFKVSTLVALRRLFDAGFIDRSTLKNAYRDELARIRALDRGGSGGGDFYHLLGARAGKRFARAVLASALEGQTLFTDAFRMLGFRKTDTFYRAARVLGVLQ